MTTTVDLRAAAARAVGAIDRHDLAQRRWSGLGGRPPTGLDLATAFQLDGSSILAVATATVEDGQQVRFLIALAHDGNGEVRVAADGDGVWQALALAAAEGRIVPELGSPSKVAAALVCRPAAALPRLVPEGPPTIAGWSERALGADQSNTSVVVGERLIVKAFRRLSVGLDPDLELNAYLSEEAGFEAVPRLAGFVELVSSAGVETVALVSEYFADASDAYEDMAERLTAWLLAPGGVAVEFATEDADALGRLTAGLHVTLAAATAPDFDARPASRDELRAWRIEALEHLEAAISVLDGIDDAAQGELRAAAPRIAEQFDVFEAVASPPLVTRIHGDLHLGQLLRTPDGFVILDFEGDPLRSLEERRALASPLRDVASMLRSIDHVGRSAARRAERRHGGPLEHSGLDLEAWLTRSRARFLVAYRRGLRHANEDIEVDDALVEAFELDKESCEFVYAATYLPSWLWAPTEGMRGLLARLPLP